MMIKHKKAQQIMSFLMNYGWALLIIAGAISALSYFGLLSPREGAPSTCMIGPGFSCMEYKADENKFVLTVHSGIYDLSSIALGFEGDVLNCTTAVVTKKGDPNVPDSGVKTNKWWFNASTVDLKRGTKIAHFEFENGCTFGGWADSDFQVYYQIFGEEVVHTIDGRANLNVE